MVKLIILGTSQDGGIPHFGCECKSCTKAYREPEFKRMVASLAIIGNKNVLLIDATPDIIKQQHVLKNYFPEKQYGFDSILITHLHIGHYLGLIHFGKESSNSKLFPLYCTKENFSFFNCNKPFSYLFSRNNLKFNELIFDANISIDDQLDICPFQVPHRNENGNTIGIEIIDKNSGKKAVYIPDTDYLDDDIKTRVRSSDKVIFDGTFYQQNELGRQKSIPHPPILQVIEEFGKQRKKKFYFTHFNHSNPVIDPLSEENRIVKDLNFIIANDGEEIEL